MTTKKLIYLCLGEKQSRGNGKHFPLCKIYNGGKRDPSVLCSWEFRLLVQGKTS